jgi:hypothetical protein
MKKKEPELLSKKIPEEVNHVPKPMIYAQLTTLKEHKARQEKDVSVKDIREVETATKTEPLPLSRATTDLRRIYPYIFECAAYAKTHNPEKMDTDLFYTRFTMPYDVFLDYCVGDCKEQIEYLKNEIYKLIKGQPAKYIKVSESWTIYGQPVIITFGAKRDPRTKKEKTITNIKQDKLVELVQVQIIKELLDVETGYINVPKAFYAAVRQAYDKIKELFDFREQAINEAPDYRSKINFMKDCVQAAGRSITTKEALTIINIMPEQKKQLEKLEQGGFHKIYLAFEYILINRCRGIKQQNYELLPMLKKCAPELVQERNGKLYKANTDELAAFMDLMRLFVKGFQKPTSNILGITGIDFWIEDNNNVLYMRVFFDTFDTRKKS